MMWREVEKTLKEVTSDAEISEINLETLLCTFKEFNFFSIFFGYITVYDKIAEQLRGYEKIKGEKINPIFLKKLFKIL